MYKRSNFLREIFFSRAGGGGSGVDLLEHCINFIHLPTCMDGQLEKRFLG